VFIAGSGGVRRPARAVRAILITLSGGAVNAGPGIDGICKIL
jgi:hypothetical protein